MLTIPDLSKTILSHRIFLVKGGSIAGQQQTAHKLMENAVAADNIAVHVKAFAFAPAGHLAAGFLQDNDACGHVINIEAVFKEAFAAAGGHAAEIVCGGSGAETALEMAGRRSMM